MTWSGIGCSILSRNMSSRKVSSIEITSGALPAALVVRALARISDSGTNWTSALMFGFREWNSGIASFSVILLIVRRLVYQLTRLIVPGAPVAGLAAAGALSAGF